MNKSLIAEITERVSNRVSEMSNSNPEVMKKMSEEDLLKIMQAIANEEAAIERVKGIQSQFGPCHFQTKSGGVGTAEEFSRDLIARRLGTKAICEKIIKKTQKNVIFC